MCSDNFFPGTSFAAVPNDPAASCILAAKRYRGAEVSDFHILAGARELDKRWRATAINVL